MNRKKGARLLGALLIAGAVFSLAACSGITSTLPVGEATLSIYNPNDPSKGVFDYINITLDGSPLSGLPSNKLSAGQTYQFPVPVANGNTHPHTFVLDFVQQPTGSPTPTTTHRADLVFTIPATQSSYIYPGPQYTAP